MMKYLQGFLLIIAMSYALGQIEDFQVIHLNNAIAVQNFSQSGGLERDTESGLSFIPRDSPQFARSASSQEVTEEDGIFQLGDYVVLCFTPQQTMYIRILDTTPAGFTHQLFPGEEGDSILVRAGNRYCAGDENSDISFYADEESGVGEGILWIAGATRREQLNTTDDDWAVPQRGLQFRNIPRQGTDTVRQGGIQRFEAWFRYEVTESN